MLCHKQQKKGTIEVMLRVLAHVHGMTFPSGLDAQFKSFVAQGKELVKQAMDSSGRADVGAVQVMKFIMELPPSASASTRATTPPPPEGGQGNAESSAAPKKKRREWKT